MTASAMTWSALAQAGDWWRLVEAPAGLVLLLKVTALLVLGWLVHLALGRANPRWRVLLWRGAAVGLVVLPVSALLVPGIAVRIERGERSQSQGESPHASAASHRAADDASAGNASVGADASSPPPVIAPDEPAGSNGTETAEPATTAGELPPSVSTWVASTSATAQEVPQATGSHDGAVDDATTALRLYSVEHGGFWLGVWLAGVGVLLVRLGLSHRRLLRLVRESTAPPEEVIRESARVAAAIGCSRPVEVRVLPLVCSPFLCGLRQPVLLLPSRMCAEDYRDELQGILVHELSHVRSRDLVWNVALHLVSVALWFHPLAWRMRAAHARACEMVADAASAGFLGDVQTYRRTLARVALAIAAPPPAAGLAMAGRSDISRRLAALARTAGSRPLSCRRVAVSLLFGLTIVALLGSLRFALAEPAAQSPAEPNKRAEAKAGDSGQTASRRMVVRIIDEAGRPIPGAKLNVRIVNDRTDHETDRSGTVAVELPGKDPSLFVLRADAPDYVPMRATWRNRAESGIKDPLPAGFTFQMEKGTAIGGVILDEAGKPVDGARVALSIGGESTPDQRAAPSIYDHVVTTDTEGKWKCRIAPSKLTRPSLYVRHPDYVSDTGYSSVPENHVSRLRAMTYQRILQKGHTVSGTVVDPEGKPVAGAALALGHSPFGRRNLTPRTDENGQYRFPHVEPGQTVVTVLAKSFAPELRRIDVGPELGPVDFRLKRGKTLRLRVVDVTGEPIAGARVVPDTWRENRSLLALYAFGIPHETDKDGRLVWTAAPDDEIQFDVYTGKHMRIRERALVPRDEEYVLTLNPPLKISGRVVDAGTGKPIDSFRIVQGIEFLTARGPYWQRHKDTTGKDGRYGVTHMMPSPRHLVRIEAPGYQPGVSRPFRSDEGTVTYDFKLEKGKGPAGVVLGPGGKPLEGADVVLCTPNNGAYVRAGATFNRDHTLAVQTGADGRFSFAAQTEPFEILVIAKEGFARVAEAELATSPRIAVQRWARLEGTLRIGAKPGISETICIQFDKERELGAANIHFDYQARTDRTGRFVFERVPPGTSGHVGRQIILNRRGSSFTSGYTHALPVGFSTGVTFKLDLGGTGRPVIGRLIAPDGDDEGIEWNSGFSSLELLPPKEEARDPMAPDSGRRRYSFRTNRDGSFRVEDVPAGMYRLQVQIHQPLVKNGLPHLGKRLGSLTHEFTVKEMPGGRSDEPLDLGRLELKPAE